MRTPQTTRQSDMRMADAVGRFMDRHFYSVLGERWERVTNPHLQRRGVDVVFGGCRIDEKVKIKGGFANRLLEYPSFELSFINRAGIRQDGWFLDETCLTEYYCFIAVFGDFVDETGVEYRKIRKLNAMFVKRDEIRGYVSKCGINLRSDIASVTEYEGIDRVGHDGTGIHVKYTDRFQEMPVNMVVRRDVLYGLDSTREFEIGDVYVEDTVNGSPRG